MIDFLHLRKSGIDTFSGLAILVCAAEAKPIRELVEQTGVTLRGVERFMERNPTLVKRQKYKGAYSGTGRPPVYEYVRSSKSGVI